MQHSHEPTIKEKILNGTSNFIQKNKIFLIIILSVLVVAIISFAVVSEITKNRLSESTRRIEEVQAEYDQWLTEESAEQKTETEQSILGATESIIGKYPKLYAAQRAYFLRGNLFFQKENWEQAIENYSMIREKFPESYLAPISMVNSAVAAEENGKKPEAISIYSELLEEYRETFPGAADALFSLGRLYEQTGDFASAGEIYEDLVNNFSSTNWTKLARNRIIKLRIDGKL